MPEGETKCYLKNRGARKWEIDTNTFFTQHEKIKKKQANTHVTDVKMEWLLWFHPSPFFIISVVSSQRPRSSVQIQSLAALVFHFPSDSLKRGWKRFYRRFNYPKFEVNIGFRSLLRKLWHSNQIPEILERFFIPEKQINNLKISIFLYSMILWSP